MITLIDHFLNPVLNRLVGRLLRLSPVDPKPSKRELRRFEKRMADEYLRDINIGR